MLVTNLLCVFAPLREILSLTIVACHDADARAGDHFANEQFPGRPVVRRGIVIVGRAILHPLPGIAERVVKPKGVRFERACRGGVDESILAIVDAPPCELRFGGKVRTIAVGTQVRGIVAKRIARLRCRLGDAARRIFPFRLGQQSVRLTCGKDAP